MLEFERKMKESEAKIKELHEKNADLEAANAKLKETVLRYESQLHGESCVEKTSSDFDALHQQTAARCTCLYFHCQTTFRICKHCLESPYYH